MKLRLNRMVSDIIVVLYIASTLFLRFIVEPQIQGFYIISVGLGLFGLLFLWALIKSEVLNPGILGIDRLVRGKKIAS